jgi:hypothetical protein
MLKRLNDKDHHNLIYLVNKTASRSEGGGYVLDFHGRVTMASVKNFQLVDPKDEDNIVLQVFSFFFFPYTLVIVIFIYSLEESVKTLSQWIFNFL